LVFLVANTRDRVEQIADHSVLNAERGIGAAARLLHLGKATSGRFVVGQDIGCKRGQRSLHAGQQVITPAPRR
jgi:hypothetical protein